MSIKETNHHEAFQAFLQATPGVKEQPSTGQAETWDPTKVPMITGTLQDLQEVNIEGRDRPVKVWTLVDADGSKVWSVWEKADLRSRMAEWSVGDQVAILYEGKQETNSGNFMMKFRVALAGADGVPF